MGIWKMPQLRHVEFPKKLEIPNPPTSKDDDDEDIGVMENLHTLKGVYNLDLNEEVVNRIPNIKKLRLYYEHCLQNLYFKSHSPNAEESLQNIASFPHSLKKLTLKVAYFCKFDDMLPKIGSLPHLQKLKLGGGSFRRCKWETSEGQFSSLKSLALSGCGDLENWTVSESSHFPCLHELHLKGLKCPTLEIPSEIGEIATLKHILVKHCSRSTVRSAKKIVDEQEDLYENQQLDLYVRAIVLSKEEKEALQILVGPNFQVEVVSCLGLQIY